MATSLQEEGSKIHHDVKQWQHCSLFNLDLFHDEHQHVNNTKDAVFNPTENEFTCSTSTVNVDEALGKKNMNHSCSFAVLQKNYTTHLEHVAEKLLANEYKNSVDCTCCQLDSNESKGQSLNRKILIGSTAILDNFLRNNLKSPVNTTSNPPSSSSSSNYTAGNVTASVHIAPNVIGGTQRRWHSERGSRHPNYRANLPLTPAQRQVLERYINYPIIKPTTNIRSTRRSYHHHVTGKAGENTGTALAALAEQPLTGLNLITTTHLRKDNSSQFVTQTRPLSSTSSSISHHSALSRRCFLADTIVRPNPSTNDSDTDDDDEEEEEEEREREEQKEEEDENICQQSISSDHDETSDEEIDESLSNPSVFLTTSSNNETLSECLICYELRRLQKRSCCDFLACSTCLNSYVEEQINQGVIRIQCPNQNCHIYMHRDEIQKRCISPELRQKFNRFFLDTTRSINMKTCPRCSNIHEIDLELCRSMRRAPTKVQCTECNLIWCFQCHSPWHDGIQCKEFRRGDRMLKKWAREVHYGQQNAQQCPSCKVYIQRTKGCDHIVCLRCKTEFCYKCGDRFRDIKFIGDHYNELSVLGCKYRFHPDNPWKRRLIRGSILGGKILAAPIILCLAAVTGTLCAGIGLPAYCCFMLVRQIKAKRRRSRLSKLKESELMNYKTLNDIVPQLIPRDPVNNNGVKVGFNSIGSNNQHRCEINIDSTSDEPIAVFNDEIHSHPIESSSSNFPHLLPLHLAHKIHK